MDSIITLTTDFGLSDGYVAAMKGVILRINGEARLIDVSHDIPPQSITDAVFVTSTAWPYFPPDAVHVCVVDPGVGTDRAALVLQTDRGLFVGPDNGVLSAALADDVRAYGGTGGRAAVRLPEEIAAYSLENIAFRLPSVSATFHGRDVFAPAAAHLSLGVAAAEFGRRVEAVMALPPFRAARAADGTLVGRIIHVDRFGNAITDVRAEDLPARFVATVAGREIAGPMRTFADANGLLALIGSYGHLAIGLRDSSAAAELGIRTGDEVRVVEW